MRTLVRFVILVGFGLCWESLTFAQQAQGVAPSTRSIARILGIPLEGQGKCGTSDMMLAIARWDQLTQQKRMAVVQALQRPQMQKDRLSPSGRFRIHYDTVGPNAPALLTGGSDPQPIPNSQEQYIDSVSYYFERAWKLEVDTLGYLPPPSDGIEGGGPEYDVYVEELGINLFGQTSWDPSAPPLESGSHVRYATYIEIDNDFYKFRTSGMDALRITSAHEFHHSIQVGNYGMWATMPAFDSWFYELTSVWMEHMAYPNIHDYYLDLPKSLSAVQRWAKQVVRIQLEYELLRRLRTLHLGSFPDEKIWQRRDEEYLDRNKDLPGPGEHDEHSAAVRHDARIGICPL